MERHACLEVSLAVQILCLNETRALGLGGGEDDGVGGDGLIVLEHDKVSDAKIVPLLLDKLGLGSCRTVVGGIILCLLLHVGGIDVELVQIQLRKVVLGWRFLGQFQSSQSCHGSIADAMDETSPCSRWEALVLLCGHVGGG